MTIPASTVSAVKDYLFAQLSTAITGPDLEVSYAEPGPGYPDDLIFLGDTDQQYSPEQMVGSGGAGWLFEAYHQLVEVSVFRGGDTPQVVFARCCELVAQVEAVVRADPSLGGLVVTAFPAGTRYESGWEEDHKGRVTEATVRIQVQTAVV